MSAELDANKEYTWVELDELTISQLRQLIHLKNDLYNEVLQEKATLVNNVLTIQKLTDGARR